MKNFPEMTEYLCFSHDGGFDNNKDSGVRVTRRSPLVTSSLRDDIVMSTFRARYAPMGDLTRKAAVRWCEIESSLGKTYEGLSGDDAVVLQPGLWSTNITSDHYEGDGYMTFLFQGLTDVIRKTGIKEGTHVGVFLSLGVNNLHYEVYKDAIKERLMDMPFRVSSYDGTWFISFLNIEIKPQPFWIMVDQLMKWPKGENLQPPDSDYLKRGKSIVIDFGSNTLQSLEFFANLIWVNDFCETVGVWETLKRQFRQYIVKKAREQGLNISDPQIGTLMDAYRSGKYLVGTHVVDVSDERDAILLKKSQQRLQITKNNIGQGEAIHSMFLAGGDVYNNVVTFESAYKYMISGEFKIVTDDDGKKDPIFSLARGGLKGAIRRWIASSQQRR